MLKIGDFSQLGRVSVRMLRHYDELGLLLPAYIDKSTSYRYYTIEQLPRLNRILALKDLGLSLKQIAILLQKDLPDDQLKQMLQKRQQELQQQIQDTQVQLTRLAARLKNLEQPEYSAYDVVIKALPASWLASIRVTVPTLAEMQDCRCESIQRLYDWLEHHRITPIEHEMILYHILGYTEIDIDMEVAISIPALAPTWENTPPMGVNIRQLPECSQAATLVHRGSIHGIPQAGSALFSWLEKNRYSSNGPVRELHLFGRETSKVLDEPVVLEMEIRRSPVFSAILWQTHQQLTTTLVKLEFLQRENLDLFQMSVYALSNRLQCHK